MWALRSRWALPALGVAVGSSWFANCEATATAVPAPAAPRSMGNGLSVVIGEPPKVRASGRELVLEAAI